MSRLRIAAAAAFLLLVWPASAAAEDAPICADRPAKGNAVCTAPAGRFQLEAAPIDWSRLRAQGTRTDVLTFGASTLKLGLSGSSDLQVAFTPLIDITTHAAGVRQHVSGFGDLVLRYKQRLTAEDGPVQLGLIPFVKLPTASGDVGNGEVEGGVAVPVSLPLGSASLTFGPELDWLADSDGNGHHAALVNLVNVSAPIAPRLTAAGELWGSWNFDPAGTVDQASADAALAYLVSPQLQLDLGANVGLNRNTPDLEVYVGTSILF